MPSAPSVAPLHFRERTLAGFVPATKSQDTALDAARALFGGAIRNLVLIGPPGVGKTHLAAGVVNAILADDEKQYQKARTEAENTPGAYHPARPARPRWINVANALVRIRLEFGSPADDRPMTDELISAHRYVGLVVLDDLGREKVSDWTGELVYALVNARYEAELPTIVTSNLTPRELNDSPYWPAISRLAEDGELVSIEAPDRRLAKP